MPQIKVWGRPQFGVPLTAADVKVMFKLAARHYDATCREAVKLHGFLMHWGDQIESWAATASKDRPAINATWGQLDICLKIMEMPHGLNAVEVKRCVKLRGWFHTAMGVANAAGKNWTVDVKVPR